MNERATELLSALQEMGVDSKDLRHCVHEAAHAFQAHLEGPWTNDEVHAAATERRRGDALFEEVTARAVEWLVLDELGEPYDPESYAGLSAMEFCRHWGASPDYNFWVTAIQKARHNDTTRKIAGYVLDLAPEEV